MKIRLVLTLFVLFGASFALFCVTGCNFLGRIADSSASFTTGSSSSSSSSSSSANAGLSLVPNDFDSPPWGAVNLPRE